MIFTRVVPGLVLGLTLVAFGPAAMCFESGHGHADGQSSENGGDAKHAEETVNTDPLEFQEDLALWTGVIFLLLLLILWKFAWGPIREGLQRREQGIAGQIAQAERSNQEARELLAQYELKLADSKEEVRGILEQARHDAEQAGREMLDKTKQESEIERKRALRQIELATTDALKQLADRSATLAVDLAGKIIGKELDPTRHAQLIARAVTNFAGQPPGNN